MITLLAHLHSIIILQAKVAKIVFSFAQHAPILRSFNSFHHIIYILENALVVFPVIF